MAPMHGVLSAGATQGQCYARVALASLVPGDLARIAQLGSDELRAIRSSSLSAKMSGKVDVRASTHAPASELCVRSHDLDIE
jgi:hypothetical protein